MQKDDILAEMKRTAKENGGKPLGKGRFKTVTGIGEYDWSKYWPRYSELQSEAGFEPNKLNSAHKDAFLLEQIARLTQELGHFPTQTEMRMKRYNDSSFPDKHAFQRFGIKEQVIVKVLEYANGSSDYEDVVKILEPLARTNLETANDGGKEIKYGFVYLVKGHPGEYKIGRTNLVDRRLSELGATSSIEQELIWEIKTDDPAGIEAYWHRRFQDKRMKGEWFRLNVNDVKAFKKWRRIY